jgi:uncharacterized membrane protein YfcA
VTWGDVVAIVGGFGAGFLSGTIGIGGGLLFVPTMTVGLRISQAVAQGTSLVAIIPTAIGGGISHFFRGSVLRMPALWMGGGGAVGAVIGALVAVEVPGPWLARIWGGFLVFSAYRLTVQAIRQAQKTP